VVFTKHLVKEIGVAAVPGSSFYNDPRDGAKQVRFAFCKKNATLDEAGKRLTKLGKR
jgi:aspartate/methionine/tyrosine aminotransferase